jgi:hypothetical protein
MDTDPRHLGDGVYIQNDGYPNAFILTANSHHIHEATDRICLDPYAALALLEELARRLGKKIE